MQSENRVNKVIIQKIIGYCNDVEELKNIFGNTFEEFQSKFAFQYSCGMCIMQIGELISRLPENFKEKHSEVAWIKIKGLRNVYAHDYESINLEKVWKIFNENIPELKENLTQILSEMENQDEN